MAELVKHMVIDYVEKKLLIDGADFPYYVMDEDDLGIQGGVMEGQVDSQRRMPVVYLPLMVDQSITIITKDESQVLKSPWFGQ